MKKTLFNTNQEEGRRMKKVVCRKTELLSKYKLEGV